MIEEHCIFKHTSLHRGDEAYYISSDRINLNQCQIEYIIVFWSQNWFNKQPHMLLTTHEIKSWKIKVNLKTNKHIISRLWCMIHWKQQLYDKQHVYGPGAAATKSSLSSFKFNLTAQRHACGYTCRCVHVHAPTLKQFKVNNQTCKGSLSVYLLACLPVCFAMHSFG